jgi:hypothetical protein
MTFNPDKLDALQIVAIMPRVPIGAIDMTMDCLRFVERWARERTASAPTSVARGEKVRSASSRRVLMSDAGSDERIVTSMLEAVGDGRHSWHLDMGR